MDCSYHVLVFVLWKYLFRSALFVQVIVEHWLMPFTLYSMQLMAMLCIIGQSAQFAKCAVQFRNHAFAICKFLI